MSEITGITQQVKDKGRCSIYVDGSFCCGLTLETVVKNRLKVGQIVTEEELSAMQLESEKNTAFDKALTHLSATRKTEKEMRVFLSGKGYLPTVIDYVVEKLYAYNFLNDGEYAEVYVDNGGKKKGGRLLRAELRNKGVSDEAIDGALGGLDGEAEEETAKRLLAKYLRGKTVDAQTRQKAYRHLLFKGFDYETAKAALREYETDDD